VTIEVGIKGSPPIRKDSTKAETKTKANLEFIVSFMHENIYLNYLPINRQNYRCDSLGTQKGIIIKFKLNRILISNALQPR
jgi:hypothetical protein